MEVGDSTGLYKQQGAANGEKVVTCPIVCIGFSNDLKPWLAERMHVEAAVRGLLTRALAHVAVQERIVLESGEGAAVVFLTDLRQGLVFGLALRDALQACRDESLPLRVGMHWGPVRVSRTGPGEPQFLGDGLETGWRIASHAGRGQIMASAAFFDAMTTQSPGYKDCFDLQGAINEPLLCGQAVYRVNGTAPPLHRAEERIPVAHNQMRETPHKVGSVAARIGTQLAERPAFATALAVVIVLVLAVALRQLVQSEAVQVEGLTQSAESMERPASSEQVPRPALRTDRTALDNFPASESASQHTATARSSSASTPSETVSAPEVATIPKALPVLPAASDDARPAGAKAPSETAKQPHSDTTTARTAPLPAGVRGKPPVTGAVRFSIVPWGEIYLDGRRLGAAPPLRDIALQPGLHRIEVRNPGFASLSQVIEIRAGDEVRIRHRFE